MNIEELFKKVNNIAENMDTEYLLKKLNENDENDYELYFENDKEEWVIYGNR